MKKKKVLTYSALRSFQTCRCAYDYRFNRSIVPSETANPLFFGSAVHSALEQWFKTGSRDAAQTAIMEQGFPVEDYLKASELFDAYANHWHDEPFDVVAIEHEFSLPLINPSTGRRSRLFELRGKVDGVVRDKSSGRLFILEHKTTSAISAEYVDRIMLDQQIAIYAEAISRCLKEAVCGAIYDILEKPSIRMKQGETDEEFEARRAELLAKSKTGKTTAKKKEAETALEFRERLRASITPENFRREIVEFDTGKLRDSMAELWAIAEDMKKAVYYKNTGSCAQFGRACPYLSLCRAGGRVEDCGGLYEYRRAHCELKSTADEAAE